MIADDIYDAYVAYAMQWIDCGWQGHLMTCMFKQLGGSKQSIEAQMDQEVVRIYSTIVSRVVRKPKAPNNQGKLPIWIVCPDWPVAKRHKDNFRDLAVNGGSHRHAIALMPPVSRMASLSEFIYENQEMFSGPSRIVFRLDCEPITVTPQKAIGYAAKSLKRRRADAGDVWLLPRSLSELSEPKLDQRIGLNSMTFR